MSENPPVVYLLHGDDEYAITQFVAGLLAKLGDSAMAELDTVRLDGRTANLAELETAASTLPFFVKRRLVIVANPTARLNTPASRAKFTSLIERVPPAIALALVEYKLLTEERERKKGKLHWLEEWASQAGERVFLRAFILPQGPAMVKRIQDQAKTAGGSISSPAAELLATLVGDNPRISEQEIQKLLAYVNFRRPVDIEDVEHLTADQGHGDVFAMVDAIGNRDGRKAINMLHRLLAEQDALSIFGMVVRQFRLLLLAREFMDEGGQAKDAARVLKLHPYVAEKVSLQARRFDISSLEAIYRRLLELDEAMKTGEIEGSLALDTLIASITH